MRGSLRVETMVWLWLWGTRGWWSVRHDYPCGRVVAKDSCYPGYLAVNHLSLIALHLALLLISSCICCSVYHLDLYRGLEI